MTDSRPVKTIPCHPVDAFVGRRVRDRRKLLKISLEGLASQLDVTLQQIQKYELGQNRLSASKLYDIAQALHVPPAFFYLGYEDDVCKDISQVAKPSALRLLGTEQGAQLAENFPRIRLSANRKKVLNLVRKLANSTS